MESVEKLVLENLVGSADYMRKTLPFIQDTYFDDRIHKVLFNEIKRFSEEHNTPPSKKILSLFVKDYTKFSKDENKNALEFILALDPPNENPEWVIQRTEKFCKDKAIYNAIMDSIQILDGANDKMTPDSIPSLLQDALSITFDKSVGHDFYDDAAARYDFYHEKLSRVPFHLQMFNKITKGGLPKKTLSVLLAGINVGKSLFMCDHAAGVIRSGKNALYITLEMAEERIAERVDCNLMDMNIDDLDKMKKSEYVSRMDELTAKTHGKLIIKEFPTAGAHVGHFRSLLDELKMKKNFVPDIIYIDYLNICASQRYKNVGSANSYTIIKAIAEEIRALAIEYDVPILSATQAVRSGQGSSDLEMSDVSESIGLPATVDFMFAMIRSEELDEMGQVMIKQLKSRFNDLNYYRKFIVGIDIAKFKFFDVAIATSTKSLDEPGRTDDDETPLFDKSKKSRDFSKINFD